MAIAAKAVCFTRADTVELLDVTWRHPGPDHVVVRMNRSGISAGTEGSILRGIRTHNGTFPLITGYHGAGVVEWVGDHAAPLQVGQRVVVLSVAGDLVKQDLQIVWGTHCSTVVTPASAVHPIPDGCSDDAASLCTLWGTGRHGVNTAEIGPDDSVLVIGLGLVGLGHAQFAMAEGARVVGLDLAEDRAEVLRSLGAEAFSDAGGIRAWLERNRLPGFSVVAQATQSAAVTDLALEFAAHMGTVVWQGWYPGEACFDFNVAHGKQVTMKFPCSTGGSQPQTLQAIADGQFNAEALITHRFPAERCQEAYNLAVYRPAECLGVVMEWSA